MIPLSVRFAWIGNAMRGQDDRSEDFFSYLRLDDRIPADHPLRAIRELVDAALLSCRGNSTSSMPEMADRRSRRSVCCGRCCCRPSTRCDRNDN